MNKWIRLSGLTLDVSIGIHDFELREAQPYKVHIALQLVNSYYASCDSIEETVDYDRLRSQVLNYLTSRHFNLQETVVQDIISICFKLDARVIAVDVSTAKTSVYPDCDAVGLNYIATRSEWLTAT